MNKESHRPLIAMTIKLKEPENCPPKLYNLSLLKQHRLESRYFLSQSHRHPVIYKWLPLTCVCSCVCIYICMHTGVKTNSQSQVSSSFVSHLVLEQGASLQQGS